MPSLFDAHCHLQDPRIGGEADGMIRRARAVGVDHLVCCGTEPADWTRVLHLAKRFPQVIPMIGLHPWRAAAAPSGWLVLLKQLARAHRVGIGECGLDFAIPGDRAAQEETFRQHLRLARELNRPVALHCVKAWERFVAVLQEEGLPEAGGLVHSYSGSAELAVILQDLGLHLSFAATVARPGNRKAPLSLAVVRPERLLLESDAPDQATGGVSLNEPARITAVVQAVARFRGESEARVMELAFTNGRRLFKEWIA
ncbi:MAG: TatD family hydrolase [Acidobacteria bacterium]|nr:TatD family hydrolase [Acidobacteriota bacterium]